MIVSISLLEALLPYLSFLAYVGVRAAKDLVNTIISDDSDVATVVTRSMNEEGHSHSIEGGDDRRRIEYPELRGKPRGPKMVARNFKWHPTVWSDPC